MFGKKVKLSKLDYERMLQNESNLRRALTCVRRELAKEAKAREEAERYAADRATEQIQAEIELGNAQARIRKLEEALKAYGCRACAKSTEGDDPKYPKTVFCHAEEYDIENKSCWVPVV